MDKAQVVFEKLGFITAHIMDAPKKKDYKSVGGYARETVNRMSSKLVGGALGAAGGATVGGLIGLALKNPAAGAGAGALLGGVPGTIVSDYRSIRRTEKETGIKEKDRTNVGGYIVRGIGAGVGGAVIPVLGGFGGDYLVSRELQKKAQLAGIMKAIKPMAQNVLKKTTKFAKGYAGNVAKDLTTLSGKGVTRAARNKALVGLAGRVGLPGYIAGDMLT